MKKTFWQYVVGLYNTVPDSLYEGLISVLCLGIVISLVRYGLNGTWRKVSVLMLVEYIILIFCATVFFRPVWYEQRFNFIPFWSYMAIINGKVDLLYENVMNIAVFFPVGLFLGMAFKSIKLWTVMLVSIVLSSFIEVLQFFSWKGFAELDDVIHNTFGCIIGYGLFKALYYCFYTRIRKRAS